MKNIPEAIIKQSLSFEAYQQLFTGDAPAASGAYTEKQKAYFPINAKRMARLLKKDRLLAEAPERIQQIDRPLHLLVITEPWCGDAAQVIPPIVQMAEQNEYLTLSFVMRDQQLALMDAFLTNGSRAIPKIIFLDPVEDYQVLGAWGPRPTDAQDMMDAGLEKWRQLPEGEAKQQFHADLYAQLQKWYTKDKTMATQEAFLAALEASLSNQEAEV
jgi:hypothetical protein